MEVESPRRTDWKQHNICLSPHMMENSGERIRSCPKLFQKMSSSTVSGLTTESIKCRMLVKVVRGQVLWDSEWSQVSRGRGRGRGRLHL